MVMHEVLVLRRCTEAKPGDALELWEVIDQLSGSLSIEMSISVDLELSRNAQLHIRVVRLGIWKHELHSARHSNIDAATQKCYKLFLGRRTFNSLIHKKHKY